MPPTFMHARDHLERAVAILQGADSRSLQLRNIIQRTIGLIGEFETTAPQGYDNVLDLQAFRKSRQEWL
jgi:hypothetical protein